MTDEKILKDKGLKDEKILKDEKLSDEELEKVAGGSWWTKIRGGININTDNDQNSLANQLGVKKAIKWD